MVLVKKNNFYFFEKGVQMKSISNQNLLEKCFSKTFEKKIKIQDSKAEKIALSTASHNLFFDNIEQKPINYVDSSSLMNSFTLNRSNPTKRLLEQLKVKINYQDSNKNLENYYKLKENTIKTRIKYQKTQKNPLVNEI